MIDEVMVGDTRFRGCCATAGLQSPSEKSAPKIDRDVGCARWSKAGLFWGLLHSVFQAA